MQNSIEYLGKQLENTPVPNESPTTNEVITILHSKIEALEETRDALKAAISETERQSNVKNHQYEELLAEFTSLNVTSLLSNLIPNRLLNKKQKIHESLKEHAATFDEEKVGIVQGRKHSRHSLPNRKSLRQPLEQNSRKRKQNTYKRCGISYFDPSACLHCVTGSRN